MTPTFRRTLASTGTVSWVPWNASTQFDLSLSAVRSASSAGTSPLCGEGTNGAIAAGHPMPDAARSVCLQALMTCTKEAVGKGNALSGTQFYSGLDGTHKAGEYRCVTR